MASASSANAQTSPSDVAGSDSSKSDDVVVTGKRIPGTAIDSIAPVAILDSAALRQLGGTNMADLMKRLKGLATSANGTEPAILLNGRRVSGFGDLQSLPPEAIERVEVLPEQEAARFGFPATMRVMNFVTKKHFRSLATQELAGVTSEGGGGTNFAELNATRIEGLRRATLSASHFRQYRVLQSQRGIMPDSDTLYAVAGNVTAVGGGSIDPALDALAGRAITVVALPEDPISRGTLSNYAGGGRAVTDIGRERTILPQTDTFRVDGTFASPLGRTIDGSLNLSLQADRTHGLSGLAAGLLTVPHGDVLPFAGPVEVYRYFPGVVLRQNSTALTLHGGATVQGSVQRWLWNVTATYDRALNRVFSENGVPLDALQAAINAGADPLAPLDPASAAQRIVSNSRTRTETIGTKAVAIGPIVRLPAGDLQLTVSAEYSRAATTISGNGVAVGASILDRSIGGASVSAVVPIASVEQGALAFLGRLSLNAMVGVSDVSRFGRLVSSDYGLNWSPEPFVQLSASVNETRTPPAIALLVSPVLATPNTPVFDFTTGQSILVTTLAGGNAALLPEKRRTMLLGASIQPIKDKEVRLSLNYIDTLIEDQSASLGGATPAFQAAFPNMFLRDAIGQLVSVDLRPVNLARERERKLRATLNFQTSLGRASPIPAATKTTSSPAAPRSRPSLFMTGSVNYRLQDQLTLRNGGAVLDLLDGATIGGTGGRPRWDMDGMISLGYGPANLGVYGRLQGATRIRSDIAASDLRFSGLTLLTLYGSLDLEGVVHRPWSKRMSVQVTVENLLSDRIDVRARDGATPNRFQPAYLDPLGRSIRLGLRKLF